MEIPYIICHENLYHNMNVYHDVDKSVEMWIFCHSYVMVSYIIVSYDIKNESKPAWEP